MIKNKYENFESFVLRTPLLSFNTLISLLQNKEILEAYVKDDTVQESLFLASPNFYNEFKKKTLSELLNENSNERILYTLIRYLSRMSTRCTPFGLFSGCAVGEIGEKNDITISQKYDRKTRLDMSILCLLFDKYLKKGAFCDEIKFFRNNSIYRIDDKYRYVSYYVENNIRKYQIVKLYSDECLDFVMNLTKDGITLSNLKSKIAEVYPFDKEEIEEYVDELISSQVLVNELSPSVTGEDYLSRILQMLNRYNVNNELSNRLFNVYDDLKLLDAGNSENMFLYQNIKSNIDLMSLNSGESVLFQVDMKKNLLNNTLSKDIVNDIVDAIEFLNTSIAYKEDETLIQFKDAFRKRYEEEEMPLSLVLDPDIGIGYPVGNNYDNSSLLDGFDLPDMKKNNDYISFDSYLLNKIICAVSAGEDVVDISLDHFYHRDSSKDLPSTFYTIFRIVSYNDESKLIALDFVGGSSGANLLSRFAYSDPSMKNLVQEISDFEQYCEKERILVEIVHLPNAKTGNILSRSHIRKNEFVYCAYSDIESKLDIEDLTISIRNDKIVIRSITLDKEILPKLSTAHNYTYDSLPVYRFLCDMQFANYRSYSGLNFGSLPTVLEYIPRVVYKNIVLRSASWLIKVEDFKAILNLGHDNLLDRLYTWRQNKKIPQYALLVDADNKLFIDFDSSLSVLAFYQVIKSRNEFLIEEFLFDELNCIVKDNDDNNYLNEFIIVFKNEK